MPQAHTYVRSFLLLLLPSCLRTCAKCCCFPIAPPPGRVTATPLAILGQLYINWTYPPSELQGYSPGYLVRYRVRGTNNRHMLHSSAVNHTSTVLTGLKAGTVYEVDVAYIIRHYIGLYSPLVFAQTLDGEH